MSTTPSGMVVIGVPDEDDLRRLDVMLAVAAAFCRQRQASVVLLHALRPRYTRRVPDTGEQLRAATRARELLRDVTLRLTTRVGYRLKVQAVTSPLPPVGALIDASQHADLVLLLRRRLSTAQRLLHGFITSSVALHAHSPVLVLPEGRPGGSGYVLVGVVDGASSRAALDFAFEEASWRGVPLVAMHAWQQHRFGRHEKPAAHDEESLRSYEQGERVLGEALAGFSQRYPDVPVRRQLVTGALLENLLPATLHAQLAVIGQPLRDGAAADSGDVAVARLLHRSLSPVVVTPAGPSTRSVRNLVGSAHH